MKLYESYKNLITEADGNLPSQVVDAINGKKVIRIYYTGDHIINKGWRWVEIYAYGLTKAGNPAIRAYQTDGVTDTESPGWKMFRLDRITSFIPIGKLFYEPRDLFNDKGDKSMIRVFNLAKF